MIDASRRAEFQHAIEVIEAQRAVLGDRVANVTIEALREKLKEAVGETAVFPSAPPRTTQRKQLTILFANVVGFSGVAENVPDTSMLNVINLLWRRLDEAITTHGGMVDKHIGDAVMGLFGVPVAGEDDPENAVRAALAMRAALSDFINEVQEQLPLENKSNNGDQSPSTTIADLRLRIGINTGPVLLGEVGTSEEYTVIGDPVNVASRLERLAPVGGVLVSHETYQLVRGTFDFEPLGPVQIKGKRDPIQVYLALGAKPHRFYRKGRGVEGVETRMVGRDAELRALQKALERVVKNQVGQVITIAGDAGVGKSRLIYEFTQWVQALPAAVLLLKGRMDQSMKQLPYALLRDLFVTTFGIQDSDPAPVVVEKLQNSLGDLLTEHNAAEWRRRIRSVAQLLGLSLDDEFPAALAPVEITQVRERAFEDVSVFLRALMSHHHVTLLVLEDVHWADEGSLDLVDHLVRLCTQSPLLVLAITRPSLFENRTKWGQTAVTDTTRQLEAPQLVMSLRALNRNESQQLVEDILRHLPEIPPDLSNLIVDRAEGNPFYVEELIKVLIEDGIIIPTDTVWRVQDKHLTNVRVPLTLTGVLQARLDRLSSLERVTLQRAAVIGRVFWDTAVILMNALAEDNIIREPETTVALQALEKRELVFHRNASVFANCEAFLFKHEMLREVAYESVLLRTRPAYHRQVAGWLAEQSGERLAEYASLIADHFELAEEPISAAEMHEMAALRAEEMANPALALRHYRRLLALLANNPVHAAWQVSVQERVARLLRLQAQLVEAAATYRAMRQTAENDGDLSAQARALNGLSDIMVEQTQYANLLETATRAEKVAWLVSDEVQLAQALRYKSEAYHRLGDTALALAAARQSLAFSEELQETTAVIQSLQLLCSLYIAWGRQTHALHFLERLQVVADQANNEPGNASSKIMAFRALGELYTKMGQYKTAEQNLLLALRHARQAERQAEVSQVLHRLGNLAYLRGKPRAAVPVYREALAIASAIGDRYGEMFYRTDLGGALAGVGHYLPAERLLRRIIQYAESKETIGRWRGLGQAYLFLAEAALGQEKTPIAQEAILKAQTVALHMADDTLRGASWHVLGLIAAQLPAHALPLMLAERPYQPGDCFQESLRLLRRAGGNSTATYREQIRTLQAWADYEAAHGSAARSDIMRQEAAALAEELE
ncbi:MAG: AAA family ATPase [Ardenticatenaceae bacterium]|nr:AAA family ATPase [Anaerolineales bacterium]MCB8983065.1 AAA family ATPase [Ardenticatenaceae bacterium]MCB8987675.1 AAA family ATPase [Ardenticatenaceae bacterium]